MLMKIAIRLSKPDLEFLTQHSYLLYVDNFILMIIKIHLTWCITLLTLTLSYLHFYEWTVT